jgi:hypothetical protein
MLRVRFIYPSLCVLSDAVPLPHFSRYDSTRFRKVSLLALATDQLPLAQAGSRSSLPIASPLTRPSPFCRRIGIRSSTFEACSGFTHVTARRIAQPPTAVFVTRLRSGRSPDQTARQLPEQSTTLWMEPSSTGDPRHRGAPQNSRLPGFLEDMTVMESQRSSPRHAA